MPCSCSTDYIVISSYYTIICTKCGLETPTALDPNACDMTTEISPPLVRNYSRPDRWKSLIKKITGVHSGPNRSDPVWNYLQFQKQLNTPDDIIKVLRKSKLKNKHYQSVHTFAKCFLKNYVPPKHAPEKVQHQLGIYFDHIASMWAGSFCDDSPFMSYAWLIEQGLELYGFREYLPYVKKLMCPERRKKYVSLLTVLYQKYGTHVETRHRAVLSNRSLNELSLPESHRNQQLKPVTPDQIARVRLMSSAECSHAGSVRYPSDKYAELLDMMRVFESRT